MSGRSGSAQPPQLPPFGPGPWTRRLPWVLLRIFNRLRRRRPPAIATMARDPEACDAIVDDALLRVRRLEARRPAPQPARPYLLGPKQRRTA